MGWGGVWEGGGWGVVWGGGGGEVRRGGEGAFSGRGPIPRGELIPLLRKPVDEACNVLDRLSENSLMRNHNIQGFRVSGMYAVSHVVEHFAYHTGQINFVTKWKLGKDLRFTRLPSEKCKRVIARVP